MASTKTPTGTSNGTSGRLPSTRERRPALAALAVLLIVGGALASAWLAMQSGHRAEYVQVGRELGQGAEIKDGDLETVELPEDFDGGIPESDREDLVGKFTATPWTPGMVVVDSMVTDENELNSEYYQIALPVDPALVPELTAGTNVVIQSGGDTAIAGTVADDAAGGDDELGSGDASAVISVPTSCGAQVTKAKQADTAEILVAGNADAPEASSTCG
ncbi:SAF domain-containing protein [Solicola gregarius]|uniref:SAF domain-containing protein n=1 Tax=Solicola gregarius TaxID=2908642 RepID=A0AA46TGI9_9ACTN|nr:SAF domain-containing protein [Solicola gregarius]UYM04944.1 SAF domain-containing protein [Solicola gregarius]